MSKAARAFAKRKFVSIAAVLHLLPFVLILFPINMDGSTDGVINHMKIITLTILAALSVSAFAQSPSSASSETTPVTTQDKVAKDSYQVVFGNLFSADRAVAMRLWHRLNIREKNALRHRFELCMTDSHADMNKMGRQPTMAEIEEHLGSGLSEDEKAALLSIKAKANMAEREVAMKVLANACAYGMANARN